ncbi:MAG: ATP-dependent DNA helicase, partial [Bdellovibrionales bacterium]
MSLNPEIQPQPINAPEIPVCTLAPKKAHILTTDGEVKTLPHGQAGVLLSQKPVLICHTPYTLSKLRSNVIAFDVLDLYLFVHPTKFCVPTPHGLSKALQIDPLGSTGSEPEDTPLLLIDAVQTLLKDLQSLPPKRQEKLYEIAQLMGLNGKGWAWTPFVCEALGKPYNPETPLNSRATFNVWKDMPEWEESAPPPPPSHHPVTEQENDEALNNTLGHDHTSENRPEQHAYAQAMRQIFEPKEDLDAPHILLAEAGTGTGKTLGYLTPSTLWAKKNEGPVWISTYTKNLQQQIHQELGRIYEDTELKDKKVAIRKGRENYLCLLNFEEATASAHLARTPSYPIGLGIMARWAMETSNGDFTGTDFPSWAQSLYGYANTTGLSDKRGECLYSACDHYSRCFREKSIRNAQHANIIIANHALVMIETATAGQDQRLPNRTIFDEGHHLFHAADSAFAAHLTARETYELRRWIVGNEDTRKKRARGLKKRFEDLITDNAEIEKSLLSLIHHAKQLPTEGWSRRLAEGQPQGPTETFLSAVLAQIRARTDDEQAYYAQETDIFPLTERVIETIPPLLTALQDIKKPMMHLATSMQKMLEQDEGLMDADTRRRIDSLSQSIERRALTEIEPWENMLLALQSEQTPSQFVDWMEIEKNDGRPVDLGLYRHWIDPMKPFATSILPHTHGLAITSATLKDREDKDWKNAHILTGANYLSKEPLNFETQSPFDYKSQAKILIINDV